MNKDELRNSMKSKRRPLSKDFIKNSSMAISNNILSLESIINAKNIMVYLSSFNEPDTFELTSKLLDLKKNISVPVSDVDTCTITPSLITSLDTLKKGAYGIYEPTEILSVPVNTIETVLIPGIAFSKSGDRLGFGKGYYDRFLSEFQGTKIGICYDFQILDTIPITSHDVKMDLIITEKRIYNDF